MRKLFAFVAGLLLAGNAFAAPAYVAFEAYTGQIPFEVPNLAQPIVSSLAPTAGAATSAVLSAVYGATTCTTCYLVFSNGAVASNVTLTNGSTAVTWATAVSAATGQAIVTSYIPAAAGHQIVFVNQAGAASATFSMTGTASTPTAVTGYSSFNDGAGNSYSIFDNLSAAAGNQYWTLTGPSGQYVSLPGFMLDFTGAASLQNASYLVTSGPGTGAGAILGTATTVASGDILVAIVYNGSNFYEAATVNSPSGSNLIDQYSGGIAYYWTGTGATITPTFTANAMGTPASDTYIVIEYDMSATGAPAAHGVLTSGAHPIVSGTHPIFN